MPTVVIKLTAKTATDPHTRHHGLAIDEPLPEKFWNGHDEPPMIGVAGGSFVYQAILDLASGLHTFEYGTCGACNHPTEGNKYSWEASIYLNDTLVAHSPCIGRDKHFIAQVKIGADAPISDLSPTPDEPIITPAPEQPSLDPSPDPGEPMAPDNGIFKRLPFLKIPISPSEPDPKPRPWQNLLPVPKQPIFPKAKIWVRVKGVMKRRASRPIKKLFAR